MQDLSLVVIYATDNCRAELNLQLELYQGGACCNIRPNFMKTNMTPHLITRSRIYLFHYYLFIPALFNVNIKCLAVKLHTSTM